MHRASLKFLAIQRLEIVQTTLAGNLALELLLPVKGHPGSVGTGCSEGWEDRCEWDRGVKAC